MGAERCCHDSRLTRCVLRPVDASKDVYVGSPGSLQRSPDPLAEFGGGNKGVERVTEAKGTERNGPKREKGRWDKKWGFASLDLGDRRPLSGRESVCVETDRQTDRK